MSKEAIASPKIETTPATPGVTLDDQGKPRMEFQPVVSARPPGAEAALGGAPVQQPSGPSAARMPQPEVIGNPTFDPPSADVLATRQVIEEIKFGCTTVIRTIRAARANLGPKLDQLAARSKDLKAKENFDPEEAKCFLNDCEAAIERLKK